MVFFQNMTLIIALTFVYTKLQALVMKIKDNSKIMFWLNCLLMGLLSLLIMLNPYKTSGLYFDLRSVPIFYVAYKYGIKEGLTASIFPALYRLHLGSFASLQGVSILIILPAVLGAILGNYYSKREEPGLTDLKSIIIGFLFYCLIKTSLLFFTLNLTLNNWFLTSWVMTAFSIATLILIVIMTNDLYRSYTTEQVLKKNAQDYKRLVEFLPDPILVYKDDKIVYGNSAAAKLLGLDEPSMLIKKRLNQIIKNYETLVNINKKIMGRGQSNKEFLLRDKKLELNNGMIIDVEIRGAIFNSGDDEFIYNVIKDISSEKMAQEMERSMEVKEKLLQEAIEYEKVKSDFFSNLSHELKTPVNLIFSTIQLLELEFRGQKLEGEYSITKRFRILKQNCNRMIRLINNLIDVTKMDSGYYQLEPKNCNIVNVIKDITLSVAEYIENKDISLTFDTDIEEKYLMVDPNAIERIMLNLLSNAVKFTRPNNQIYVNIHDAVEHVIISVKDKGIGIPLDKLEVIFDRFRQVDKSLTRSHEGSGIGLSLVKSLVSLHNGEVNVQSEFGEGSEFVIVLPVKEAPVDEEGYDEANVRNRYIETINIEFSDIYSAS